MYWINSSPNLTSVDSGLANDETEVQTNLQYRSIAAVHDVLFPSIIPSLALALLVHPSHVVNTLLETAAETHG